jgi:hypothetical protein
MQQGLKLKTPAEHIFLRGDIYYVKQRWKVSSKKRRIVSR